MRLFLDTANVAEVHQAAAMGVISGVTTNPSLVAKEKSDDFRRLVVEICSLVEGPVSVEATSLEVVGMIEQARELASWAPNVVIKLPITAAGLAACKTLRREGIHINMTLCFSVNQALLAAAVGATFVSPFVGRLDDIGHDGMQIVAEIAAILRHYALPTQLLAASIRHPLHVVAAAKAGAHIATVPYKVLMQMIEHPLTKAGLERFLADWAAAGLERRSLRV